MTQKDILPLISVAEEVKNTPGWIKRNELWWYSDENGQPPRFCVDPYSRTWWDSAANRSGDILELFSKIQGEPISTLVRAYEQKFNYTLPSIVREKPTHGETELGRLNQWVADYYLNNLLHDKAAQKATELLTSRSLPADVAVQWKLGFAKRDGHSFYDDLIKQGFDKNLIQQSGLLNTKKEYENLPFFYDRIVFPIHDWEGIIIGFAGRALNEDLPKYLNITETPLFKKGNTLYGIHQAKESISSTGKACLCEGYMDVIALHQSGITYPVAPMGTAFTPSQAALLKNIGVEELTLMLDGDSAGIASTKKAISTALDAGITQIKVVAPYEYKDARELLENEGPEALQRAYNQQIDAIEWLIHQETPKDVTTGLFRWATVVDKVGQLINYLGRQPQHLESLTAACQVSPDIIILRLNELPQKPIPPEYRATPTAAEISKVQFDEWKTAIGPQMVVNLGVMTDGANPTLELWRHYIQDNAENPGEYAAQRIAQFESNKPFELTRAVQEFCHEINPSIGRFVGGNTQKWIERHHENDAENGEPWTKANWKERVLGHIKAWEREQRTKEMQTFILSEPNDSSRELRKNLVDYYNQTIRPALEKKVISEIGNRTEVTIADIKNMYFDTEIKATDTYREAMEKVAFGKYVSTHGMQLLKDIEKAPPTELASALEREKIIIKNYLIKPLIERNETLSNSLQPNPIVKNEDHLLTKLTEKVIVINTPTEKTRAPNRGR